MNKSKKYGKKVNNLEQDRLAIIDPNKCRPDKCKKECKSSCPIESQGIECISVKQNIMDIEDIGNFGKQKNKRKELVTISETNCIGCNICIKKCPYDAIKIYKLPSEIGNFIVFRYSPNSFRLYKLPILKPYQILGLIGQNGIGKSTVINILANKIKPNFENFSGVFDDDQIVEKFKGTELHKFFENLYGQKIKVVIKSQHVDRLVKHLINKDEDPTVFEYLFGQKTDLLMLTEDLLTDEENVIIDGLELVNHLSSKVRTLSGGLLQSVVCASTLLTNADLYIFDEPSNYLDIGQRIKMARLIKRLSMPDKYVVVIEHDLAILDYISDYVCIMYGKPSAYGVVSMPYSTAEAINNYFDGYIPAENIKFRTEDYQIKNSCDLDAMSDNVKLETNTHQYDGAYVEYPKFQLTINAGTFPKGSSITVILGQNGTGKTTLLNQLKTQLNMSISYKTQYLDPEVFRRENTKYMPTVEEVFLNDIREAYISEQFRSDVLRPLDIDTIKNLRINELSGGMLQRFSIVYHLGLKSDIYFFDEPSAYLDIEQRVLVTKIIKRFVMHNDKIGFIVEHDMMMAVSLAQEINGQIIVMESEFDKQGGLGTRKCIASSPMQFNQGINKFLKTMDITFRTDSKYSKHSRPRINKLGGSKDRDQKARNVYYE